MIDSAAILSSLSTRIKTATNVLYMDTTGANPLLRPYMIQPRLLGVTWADAWDDMTLDEHTRVGKTVVDELIELGKITFPHPGRLAASPDSDTISLQELRTCGQKLPLPENPSLCTVEEWLSFLLDWQIQSSPLGDLDRDSYHILKKILQSMVSRGYFANLETIRDCVLSHGDLHTHNIVVLQDDHKTDNNDNGDKNSKEWKLAGLIDWDTACSIPRILSHQPLEWLWADHLYEDQELLMRWTGHLDFVPEDKWDSMPKHMSELKQRIDHYASSIIPGYAENAYGRGRWIRRMAKFAMVRISDNRESTMLEWMIAEWAKVEARDLPEASSPGC